MTVLVTGGAGYIGSHTVRLLRSLGREVVVLDTLERGRKELVLDAPLVVGDVADDQLVARTVSDYDVSSCIHFAAYKAVGESMEEPGRYFANNVTGSQRMIEALHRGGVSEIVFSSSCSVYGTPSHVPVREDAPLDPESVYAATKRMIEDVLRWYGVSGVRSVSLRYFNAAGAVGRCGHRRGLDLFAEPGPADHEGHPGAPATAAGVRDRLPHPRRDGHPRLHPRGGPGRRPRAGPSTTWPPAARPSRSNVGTGVGSSVQEVIDAAERITGHAVPREYVGRRAGDPVSLYSDNELVTATLGWKASQGLDEIIATAWQWHSTHPDL